MKDQQKKDDSFMPKPRVAIVLGNTFAVRNTFFTPVFSELISRRDLDIAILTPSTHDQKIIQDTGAEHISWFLLHQPLANIGFGHGGLRAAGIRLAQRICMRPFLTIAGFGNLAYRFNELQRFVMHAQKKKLPHARRVREAQAGNFLDQGLGRPFPNSHFFFKLLYKMYYATWYSEPSVEAFFDSFQPDRVVLHPVQVECLRPYNTAARRRRIPLLGIVGSWDQPTTKGPICPGLSKVAVQSENMSRELQRYHGFRQDQIAVTGWPQMDYYKTPGVLKPRDEFLAELGLSEKHRYVLMAGYSARLGAHEPSIASHLVNFLKRHELTKDLCLIIRPHPKDGLCEKRFGHLRNPPKVVVLQAEWGRLDFLANLLYHGEVLLSTGGTISLDAIALDTKVINLAFDGDLDVPSAESVGELFKSEHYSAVVETRGVKLVKSYAQLEDALINYLRHPSLDQEGRQRCLREQLHPFDGLSSHRLVEFIAGRPPDTGRE